MVLCHEKVVKTCLGFVWCVGGFCAVMASKEAGKTKIHLRVPSVVLKKPWGGRPSELQQFDEDLIRHTNLQCKLATIAEPLQKEYNLNPNFMTPEKVNRRLHYLKQNKLAKLPPTNSEISLLATDTSKPM